MASQSLRSSFKRWIRKRCVSGVQQKLVVVTVKTPSISIHHFLHKIKHLRRSILRVRFVRRHKYDLSPTSKKAACDLKEK